MKQQLQKVMKYHAWCLCRFSVIQLTLVSGRMSDVWLLPVAGKSCYTVWSGPLVNKGQELFPICLRSSLRPYLPFKLWVNFFPSHASLNKRSTELLDFSLLIIKDTLCYTRFFMCWTLTLCIICRRKSYNVLFCCSCCFMFFNNVTCAPVQAWEVRGESGHAARAGEAKDSLSALFLGHLQRLTGRLVQNTHLFLPFFSLIMIIMAPGMWAVVHYLKFCKAFLKAFMHHEARLSQ